MAASAALVGGLAFATAPSAAAAGACKPSGSAAKITKGEHGKQARAAECLLKRGGFRATVNGHFSSTDRQATKAFQSSRGLKATGNVNKRTWVALISQGTKVKLVQGSKGSSVVRLQKSLSAYGKNVQPTGYYGKITKSRVKAIQSKYGWKQTGIVGKGVWSFLQHGGHWSKPKPAVKAAHVSSSSKGLKALSYAKKQLGDPYSYGANGPGSFDCSGLTQAAWRSAGVKLAHNTNAQFS
ncbi:MAG TPA: peptidoglycan-binding protein, partial [Microlunatus sp.]